MEILNVAIIGALLMTVATIGSGIWSMAHGGEYDQEHSTQFMLARVVMQGITVALLLLAIYIAN